MQVKNYANLPKQQIEQIESELAQHQTLGDVLNWGLQQPEGSVLPHVVAYVIVQDEYSHDVIVPWRDGLVIAYGTT